MTPTHRPRALDHGIAWSLAIATIVVLAMTADMGFTRDESFYFYAARVYGGWFTDLWTNLQAGNLGESFTQANIDRHWGYNPEHPVLVKTAFALSGLVLHDRLDWLSPSLAYRFPAFVFTGWLVAVLYLFTLRAFASRAAAVLAPVLLLTIPRFFFHAHLTCFDVPMTAVWVAFMYAYWRSLDSTAWAWLTGVMWGIALITKLNAFFLPFVVLAHWGIRALTRTRVGGDGRVRVPPVPFALFAMALVGPVIFYAGWPRHWFDTWQRVLWYLRFHVHHEHYFIDFFGEALIRPPFPVRFPFVMTAVTTPLPHLAAFAAGVAALGTEAFRRWRSGNGDPRGTGWLIVLNILIPMAIIARPSTPVFGGIKHWFPSLPFLCMVAAVGIVRVGALLPTRARQAAVAVMAVCTVGVGTLETVQSHPYGTSHYSALVGSYTGAADRRAMRQFWGYAGRGALEWLDEHAESGARVHFHNTTPGAFDMYQQEGWLRSDISYAWTLDGADWFVFHHQKSFEPLHYQLWDRFGTQSPSFTVTVHGVPVVSVYRNERRAAARDRRRPEARDEEGSGEGSGELGVGETYDGWADDGTDDPGTDDRIDDGSADGSADGGLGQAAPRGRPSIPGIGVFGGRPSLDRADEDGR